MAFATRQSINTKEDVCVCMITLLTRYMEFNDIFRDGVEQYRVIPEKFDKDRTKMVAPEA